MQTSERRFLKSLIEGYPHGRKNVEAEAVFDAIQRAFDVHAAPGPDRRWMTDPDMVAMLAACAYTAIGYLNQGSHRPEIDLLGMQHDFILARTLRGFMATLAIAIRRGATRQMNGRTYFRSFQIPDWFVDEAKNRDDETPDFYPTPEAFIAAHETVAA